MSARTRVLVASLTAACALASLAAPAAAAPGGCSDGAARAASIDRPHVVDARGDTNFPAPLAAQAPAAVGQYDVARIWVSEPSPHTFDVNVELAAPAASAPGYTLVAYVAEARWVTARRNATGWTFEWGETPAGSVASGDLHAVRGTTTGQVAGNVMSIRLPQDILPDLGGGAVVRLPRLLVATGTGIPLPDGQFLLRPVADTSFNAVAQCAVVLADNREAATSR